MNTELKSAISLTETELPNYCSSLIDLLKPTGDMPKTLLFISGILGAGKTTFCRNLISSFAKDNIAVQSPTFNLENRYYVDDTFIHHIDFYRVGFDEDLFFEMLQADNQKHFYLIEWGEKILEALGNYASSLPVSMKNKVRILNINIEKLEDARIYSLSINNLLQ